MVADHDVVSDILQEVFMDLYTKLDRGFSINHYKSWLYRATINKCFDHYRQQKRFQNIESIRETGTDSEPIEKQEIKSLINHALSKLKPKERMLVVLYSEGLSYKEIAKASGVRFSSIGKMLSRILKKLETELKSHRYDLFG
jgi:RNA polymerase sigma-70 factor (ECF subfamily)